MRYTNLIDNIIDYSSSISQNKIKNLFDSFSYGEELQAVLDLNKFDPNPRVVAALEQVKGFERAHDMKLKTPSTFYKDYKQVEADKGDYLNILASRVSEVLR